MSGNGKSPIGQPQRSSLNRQQSALLVKDAQGRYIRVSQRRNYTSPAPYIVPSQKLPVVRQISETRQHVKTIRIVGQTASTSQLKIFSDASNRLPVGSVPSAVVMNTIPPPRIAVVTGTALPSGVYRMQSAATQPVPVSQVSTNINGSAQIGRGLAISQPATSNFNMFRPTMPMTTGFIGSQASAPQTTQFDGSGIGMHTMGCPNTNIYQMRQSMVSQSQAEVLSVPPSTNGSNRIANCQPQVSPNPMAMYDQASNVYYKQMQHCIDRIEKLTTSVNELRETIASLTSANKPTASKINSPTTSEISSSNNQQ